jgi:hypothetical protein
MRLLALLVALQSPTAATVAPPPLTLSQLATLPEQELVRRLFGAMAPDIFLGSRPDGRSGSLRLRASVWAWTRPRAADRPGVCESDRVTLEFSREISANAGDPSLRLRQIVTQTHYSIQDRALAEGRRQVGEGWRGALQFVCEQRDPRRDMGTPADSPYQLMKAFALVNQLSAAARAGRVPVPLDCAHLHWNGPSPVDEAECLRELGGLGDHSLGWVSECRGTPAAVGGCIRVLAGEIFIEFSLNQRQEPVAIVIQAVEDNSAVE